MVTPQWESSKSASSKTQNRKNHMPEANTTTAVNRQIINSSNYALMRDKGFTNAEIETMWMMPRQAIAAFQAWNTMSGKKWNNEEQDLNTIHLGRRVCRNTFIPDTEDNKI